MQCCLLNGDHGWSTNVFHHQIFIGIGKNILLLVPILAARVDLVANKMRPSSLLLMVRLADVMTGLLLMIQVGADRGSLKRIRNRACIADGLLVGVGMRLLVLLLHCSGLLAFYPDRNVLVLLCLCLRCRMLHVLLASAHYA